MASEQSRFESCRL